ncbi:hypothetical protein ACIQC9_02900 [Brevundimonas sp. NPDC092305]|uniref:hypothetical protein n=1 Tax=Brevundimonas sp. NPDC092305 TaxID=3363957 RepID=UPI00380ED167
MTDTTRQTPDTDRDGESNVGVNRPDQGGTNKPGEQRQDPATGGEGAAGAGGSGGFGT